MRLATSIFGDQNQDRDIVLIHGTGAHGEMWRHLIPLLNNSGFRCVVPDLRGHGQTAEPGDRADIEAHLSDILETLDAEHVSLPCVFAGHSLGAIIAIELAQRRPELISKVLAVSMPARVPGITTGAFRWFLGWPYSRLKQAKLHRHLGWRPRTLIETDKYALEQVVLNFASLDYCSNVPKVLCPVHFVVGRFDPVAPYFHTENMHQLMPESTLEIIEWAGHNCMDSQPASFNRWFFDRLKS